MKFNGTAGGTGSLSVLLLIAIALHSPTFANSIIVGGRVPERHTVIVTRNPASGLPATGGAVEVAVIEIDNNLPEYELALDLTDRYGGAGSVAEVRLEGLDGTLGAGLAAPARLDPDPGGDPGRYYWRPGPQGSATVGYRMRVLVTYRDPDPEAIRVGVSMSMAY